MIYSLVTLYTPDDSVTKNMLALSGQVDKIYLIDNSAKNNCSLFSEIKNAEYLFCGKNHGLSSAFNKILKEKDFGDNDFIIFFDQDSHISENFISSLKNEYENLEKSEFPVGCIGPVYFNTSSGIVEIPKQKIQLNEHSFSVKSIITSSMLLRFRTLKEIGFWNEEIFLDMADWDVCWRLIEHKKLCCMTNVVTLHHTLGKGEKKVGFIRVKEGSPFRVYYQTRDCLRLITKKYVPFKYKIRFVLMLTVRPIVHLIVLSNKKERIKYFIKGIHDFNKGIYGSL